MNLFFKKIRFIFRLTLAFFKKRLPVILIGIFLGAVFFRVSPLIITFFPRARKVEKIGLVGKYSITELPPEVLSKISKGLTHITPEGKVEPELSDRWEVSPDGKVYTFYFGGKKHFWHDGTEFNLGDINYNFKDAKILQIGSGILKIVLEEPFSPFPSVVCQPIFKKGLIGLGSYKVKKIEKSGKTLKSIVLVPVDKKSNLPVIIYRFYLNESQIRTAFKLGEINKIEELESPGEFEQLKNVNISKYQKNDRYVALFFKTDNPPCDEKSFRQAIAYSITKENNKSRAIGPISSLSWVYNPGVKKYEKDISKAKLLMSKVKLNQKAPFLIYTFPTLEEEGKKILSELKEIGLEVEIKITNFLPENFDLLLAVQKIPADPDQYSFWHTGQASNLTHFSNPRIDKLLEDGRKTHNEEERKKIYFDFQRFLVEESPAVFLYYPTYYTIERK